MSGPKCDKFELAEQRRLEEMERLRRELEEKRRQEEESRRKLEEERRQEEERKRKLEEERQQKEMREAESEAFNEQEEEAFEALLQRMYRKRERQIVTEAIEETMVEMGYELIAAQAPSERAGDDVSAQVYSFSNGTGIQVMECGGQVSLEVVGLGTNNRLPDETERSYLEEQMADFCDAYEDVEERLAKKGIVRAQMIFHKKPDKKYARILNLSVLEQKKQVDTLQAVLKRQKKTTKGEFTDHGRNVSLLRKMQ